MIQLRPRAPLALPALASLALALGGCSLDVFGPGSDLDELLDARSRWERQGIDDYRYTFHRSCGECLPEWASSAVVEVRGGQPVSVAAASPARPIRRELYEGVDTVEELFVLLEEAISRDPYRYHARYDGRRGFPVNYWVDFDESAVDDEVGFVLTGFEVIR